MQLLVNKDIRRFFWVVLTALILLLISGLIFSQLIVHDFKARMLAHDYKVAGYLLEHGANPSDVAAVFAAEKTAPQLSSGKALLQALGYKGDINNRLLSDANMLLSRYQLIIMLFIAILGTTILTAFFFYFKHRQRVIEKANISINAFMGGDTSARIDSEEEGDLSKLFASINTMATSLDAHIRTQEQIREFLKGTISDISHQLKTPLTALRMYNEIITEENANPEAVKKYSVQTAIALERMEILIQNLLKIAKLDAGTITLNKKKENIGVLIQKIIYGFETRTAQEQKKLTIKGPENIMLYCDGDWLTEAIGNLVKNALDHTGTGGKVEITWKETPAVTRIIINDNGKGIHPEDIHHIFKRFYRSRFSQDTQGIGLGLPIIEAHNGTITVESTPEKGSEFTLDFLKLTNL